ncbi:protein kinase [Nocardia sp. NPDC050408]|uniref:serine/threonine-protein kinase n=1 Tax=Nocardia sp. NPDC050408 TaxID=3364319 RepID=UPI0037917E7B
MRDLSPGDVFAGYVIQRVLGQGGMGSVYLARHPRLPRLVALKLLNRDLTRDDAIRARFLREADNVSRLEHPNIVHVYDRGREQDQLWISMQYVDGSDAANAVQRQGRLAVERAVRVVAEVAKALDHAHAEGILHRDVKPANILLAKAMHGADERVLLADFGIAKSLEDTHSLTTTGSLLASLPYAAPEQFYPAAESDERTDVYALGCTLYQLVTGELPYPGTTPMQLLHGHLNAPIPKPTVTLKQQNGQQLPSGLDDVIAHALAKDRAQRYRSCGELARDAQAAVGEQARRLADTQRAHGFPSPDAPEHPREADRAAGSAFTAAATIIDSAPTPSADTTAVPTVPAALTRPAAQQPPPTGPSPRAGEAANPLPLRPAASSPTPPRRGYRGRVALIMVPVVVAVSTFIGYQVIRSHSTGTSTITTTARPTPPTIPLEVRPDAIAVDPSTHAVYVASSDTSNRVSVLDPTTGRTTAVIPLSGDPHKVAVDSESHAVYASGSDGTDPYVDLIDPVTSKVTATLKTGPPKSDRVFDFANGLLVDPGTHLVYAFNTVDGWLSVIDPATRTVTTTRGGSFTYAVDPVAHKLVGINIASNTAFTIDPATGAATDQTDVKDCCTGPVVFDPSTRTLYANDYSDQRIVAIDLTKHQVAATISASAQTSDPEGIALDVTARTLYAANGNDRSISVIDLTRNTVTATLAVADNPDSIALDPSTRTLYVISAAAKTVTILHL